MATSNLKLEGPLVGVDNSTQKKLSNDSKYKGRIMCFNPQHTQNKLVLMNTQWCLVINTLVTHMDGAVSEVKVFERGII